ncbi:hypothetical protein ACFWUP_25915 [Nocardia sp. NPDC058658]|uniref:hypothetical protein n=1 Tax=Nocardia sp. NPDC058658 TaxID=3346580 RepID=UPI00365DDC42
MQKTMKRSLAVLAGATLVWGATACSDNNSTPSPTPSSTTTAAPSTSPAGLTSASPQPTTSPEQRGADGSTGNNLSAEYCAKNQDPGCPAGSYVGPNAIQNPNGDGTWVPCEGTICTNPNHGAGTPEPTTPAPVVTPTTTPADSAPVAGAPCEGDGRWVHLEGGNAGHYGTEWLCQH